MVKKYKDSSYCIVIHEALLLQMDCATCYVSEFVLSFTRYGRLGVRKVPNSESDPQGHSRALAMVPFDTPRTISY